MPRPHCGPSPHLSWNELSCHDAIGTPYPIDYRTDPTRLPKLAVAFEAVRALYDEPLTIDSAYRTPDRNWAVGGKVGSQHLQGRALDVLPPKGVSVRDFYGAIVRLATERPDLSIRFVQGYAKGWVHFDVRPTEQLVTKWEG